MHTSATPARAMRDPLSPIFQDLTDNGMMPARYLGRFAFLIAITAAFAAFAPPARAQAELFAPVVAKDANQLLTILAQGMFTGGALRADDPTRTAGFGESGPRTSPNFALPNIQVDASRARSKPLWIMQACCGQASSRAMYALAPCLSA
jgi:hypothetical protein